MHIGKDLHVPGWTINVFTDPSISTCSQADQFIGKMDMKQISFWVTLFLQVLLTQKKMQQGSDKGLIIRNQIRQILDSTYFGMP